MRYPSRAEQRGSVTAEFAIALPGIIFVLACCLSAVQIAGQQVRLYDVAASAARSVARDESLAEASSRASRMLGGVQLSQRADGDLVCVTARLPAAAFALARLQLRARWWALNERGAGSILAISLIAAVVTLSSLLLPLYLSLATRHQVAGAADAAALAAADVASGRLPGYPCQRAADVAAANGAQLASCELDGLVATVTASRTVLGISVSARATAGPNWGRAD